MKKINYIFAALAAISFAGCSKEAPVAPATEKEGVFMTLEAEIPSTKSTYSYDEGSKVLKAAWSAEEKISVVTLDVSSHDVKTVDTFTSTGEAGRAKASFSGVFTGDPSDEIMVWYPALTDFNGDASHPACTDPVSPSNRIWLTIGGQYCNATFSEYHQTTNDSFDPWFDLMRGSATIDGGVLHAKLAKMVRILRMEIDCSDIVADGYTTVNSVYVNNNGYSFAPNASSVWAYAQYVEEKQFMWGFTSANDRTIYLGTRQSANTYDSITIPASGKIVVYMPDYNNSPLAATKTTYFTVKPVKSGADSYKYSKTHASDVVFVPGQEYNVKFKVTKVI